MKEKIKFCGYTFVLLMAVIVLFCATNIWQEREELQLQHSSLRKELAQVQLFASEHKDYAAYSKRRQQEIASLERELVKRGAGAECLKLVQKLAAAQGVRVISVQTQGVTDASEAKNNGTARGGMTLRITAAGNFFDVLRWLRKMEREGIAITNLRVQNEKISTQTLQIELLVKLHSVNL